jgi:hypothetical protein
MQDNNQLLDLLTQISTRLARLEQSTPSPPSTPPDASDARTDKRKALKFINRSSATPFGTPSGTFRAWWKEIIDVKDQLEEVFEYDLTAGIRACILKHIDYTKSCGDKIPMQSCKDNPGKINIYTLDKAHKEHWRLITEDDIKPMIEHLRTMLTNAYIEWQKEHKEEMDENAALKEANYIYMAKVHGYKMSAAKQEQSIKTWMASYISE